jgi:type III secretory pathway component EscV
VLDNLVEQRGETSLSLSDLPPRFKEFVIASCAANRDDLLNLLSDCADRLTGMQNPRLQQLGNELRSGHVLDQWLGHLDENANAATMVSSWESEGRIRPRIQLVFGSALKEALTKETCQRWQRALSAKFGTPLPPIDLTPGDEGEFDLELRLRGRRVAVETFFPRRCQVLMRHWEKTQTFTPPDVASNDNEVMQEVVLWLEADHLRQANWELPSWTADEAMLYWIELLLRQYFDYVFDYDLLNEFSREFDIRGIQLPHLREVIVNLVHESVPAADRWPDLIEELQRAPSGVDVATQMFREQLGPAICQQLMDKYGQLSVIILDEVYEKNLLNRLRSIGGGQQLPLEPVEAQALTASISRYVARSLRESDVMPVVACERSLRLPLLRLIERFDPRVRVLSYTELTPDLRLVDAGMVSEGSPAAAGD